jgi:hypothetical protein
MLDDGSEVFPPTADGILAWVETTRETGGRRPSREAVVEHVESLRERGLISDADVRRLAGEYPELSP